MSVADRHDQEHELPPADVDLGDLGTVPEQKLEAARADPQRQNDRRAALEALDALERDGRLLIS